MALQNLTGAVPAPTARLGFRPLLPADAGWLAAGWGRAGFAARVGESRPTDVAEVAALLERRRRAGDLDFAIELHGAARAAGRLALQRLDLEAGSAEIEVELLDPGMRGSGLGGEAAHALLAFARDRLGLVRVFATIAASNAPSLAVARRLGFEPRRRSLPTPVRSAVITMVWCGATRD